MDWGSFRALGLTVLLLGVLAGPATAGTTLGSDTQQIGEMESDLVIISADVAENGTATFQIEYAIRLDDENDSQAFDELANDIEQNESAYVSRFADRMQNTVSAAETSTGRSMTVRDFGVTARTSPTLGNQYGTVTYTATWENFANVTNGDIQVGDALAGLFLDEETRLRIEWPETYQRATVDPAPTGSSAGEVVWEGPRQFEGTQPALTLEPTPTTSPDLTTTETTAAGDGLPWVPIGLLLLALVVLGGWYVYRETESEPTDSAGSVTEPAEPEGESGEPTPPSELLSNEERVEQYLASVGGRAKQQEIVEALDWTEAKTSQVLSDMSEAGEIEKFRIGRENVVKLPESGDESV
ncbi:hypothetical protein HTSR_1148 [Halodesulfurarchaeum formicicum]|uniref:DUF4897 domain-containing protein n=1 Tax=Halodesulfurarchaeum formicicum TaxID=1873524 RepID=A0A1D8S4P4_9EURY|nr:DUF4897 domain-containing protein [Halodesulfurarchaeum formicicum]AOW80328.1 hypothetical protein HTSR_1148 [Halodesulfurarchaeum formicicum]